MNHSSCHGAMCYRSTVAEETVLLRWSSTWITLEALHKRCHPKVLKMTECVLASVTNLAPRRLWCILINRIPVIKYTYSTLFQSSRINRGFRAKIRTHSHFSALSLSKNSFHQFYYIHPNRKSLLWWWQRIFWANQRDTRVSRLMSWTPWPRFWVSSMTSTKLEMGSTAQHSLMDPGMVWLENSLARLVCFLFISVNQCPDFTSNNFFWESGFEMGAQLYGSVKWKRLKKHITGQQPLSDNQFSLVMISQIDWTGSDFYFLVRQWCLRT